MGYFSSVDACMVFGFDCLRLLYGFALMLLTGCYWRLSVCLGRGCCFGASFAMTFFLVSSGAVLINGTWFI